MTITFAKAISKKVDTIARLDAEIAALSAQREKLINIIKNQGEGKYGGSEHYVSISVRRAVTHPISKLKTLASRQWLKAHERVTESVVASVRGYNKSKDGKIIMP